MQYWNEIVKNLTPYIPGEQPRDVQNLIKLNTNENPYPASPKVIQAINNIDTNCLRLYPDALWHSLRNTIASRYDFPDAAVFCGNGSDEVLSVIFKTFFNPKDVIVIPYPNYSLYETLAQLHNVDVEYSESHSDFTVDFENILSRPSKAVFLSNPNAPTGIYIPKPEIKAFLDQYKGLVIMDEAYMEFADDYCFLYDVMNYDNILITRTFSKGYSLASLRIGYAVGNPDLIKGMMQVKDSYNLNLISQVAAEAAFKDTEYYEEVFRKIRKTRRETIQTLTDMGYTVYPSQSNYVFCKPPEQLKAEQVYQYLKGKGIFVRYFAKRRVEDYLRISIGTDKEMQTLFKALNELT